jgi:hypothetical protein
MPIRPELRKYYGPAWRRYRLQLIALAGQRCSVCGDVVAETGGLSGMHVTHDPRDMELVAVACFSCHAKHDALHRLAMMRRSRAKRTGQLWLLPEIEYAPYAAWMIPRRFLDAMQGRLF